MGAMVNVNVACSIKPTWKFYVEDSGCLQLVIPPKGRAFHRSRLFVNKIYFR